MKPKLITYACELCDATTQAPDIPDGRSRRRTSVYGGSPYREGWRSIGSRWRCPVHAASVP